ncbi:MAG: 2-hydroxychromene-2-carboxylate isomerase [Thermoplasmatota archaeon]
MTEPRQLHVYFDYGSPYSYLAWHRITQAYPERYQDVEVLWKPVSAAHLFRQDGSQPNALAPNLWSYTKEDVLRWAKAYGLDLVIPASSPTRSIEASRLHFLADQGGPALEQAWMEAVWKAHWHDDQDLGNAELMARLAESVGIEDAPTRCNHESVKRLLVANTVEAYEAGAPGVPFFVLDGEGYWGNDRMKWVEEAAAGNAPSAF